MGGFYVFEPGSKLYHEAKACYQDWRHSTRPTEEGWGVLDAGFGMAPVYRLRVNGRSRLLSTVRTQREKALPKLGSPWAPKFWQGVLVFTNPGKPTANWIEPGGRGYDELRKAWLEQNEAERAAKKARP